MFMSGVVRFVSGVVCVSGAVWFVVVLFVSDVVYVSHVLWGIIGLGTAWVVPGYSMGTAY